MTTQQEKKLEKEILTAFDEKADDLITWKGKTDGDYVIGKCTNKGIASKHNTPFIEIIDKEMETKTIYLSRGLEVIFERLGYLSNKEWIVDPQGDIFGIQYKGTMKNPNTNQEFRKYKVLTASELPEIVVKSLKAL